MYKTIAPLVVIILMLVGCRSSPESNDGSTDESSSSTTVLSEDELQNLASSLKLRIDACAEDIACQAEALDKFYAECMTTSGFLTVRTSDGFWTTESGGRDEELVEASQHCDARANSVLPASAEITDDYLSNYYDFLLEVRSCVEAEGYAVEPPPSRESFIESQGAEWHPYEGMDRISAQEFNALERACPQDFRG